MLVFLTLLFLYGTVAIDPSLTVPPCMYAPDAMVGQLVFVNGSAQFPEKSEFYFCWNQTGLIMYWEAEQDAIIRNDYVNCNDPIYNQEVIEIIIGPGYDTPITYKQVSISPFGVLFMASVFNPHFDGSDMVVTPQYPCNLNYRVDIDIIKDEWSGQVVLPWNWLMGNTMEQSIVSTPGSGKLPAGVSEQWRANVFRIAMRNSVPNCTLDDCDYGAWSPTGTNTFHVSYAMGGLTMVEADPHNNGASSIAVTSVLPVLVLLLLQKLW
jgi:hypothetical protein